MKIIKQSIGDVIVVDGKVYKEVDADHYYVDSDGNVCRLKESDGSQTINVYDAESVEALAETLGLRGILDGE